MGPYPYARWPKVTAAEVERRRRVARWLPPDGLRTALDELGELAGGRFRVVSEELFSVSTATLEGALPDPLVALALELPGIAPGRGPVLELDRAFASSLIERLLGAEGQSDGGIVALDGVRRGVLAFAAGRALGRLAEPRPRLAAVWTTPEVVKAYLGASEPTVEVWSLVLALETAEGTLTTTARAWLPPLHSAPRGSSEEMSSRPRTARLLRVLELDAVVDAGEARLPAAEVASLALGDAVVLDTAFSAAGRLRLRALGAAKTTWWLARGEGHALEVIERVDGLADGRHSLPSGVHAALRSSARSRMRVNDDDELRTERTNPQTPSASAEQADPADAARALARLGDAPVELSVELARFRLSVEELAALREGEVLPAGALIGGAAHLRAGDVLVARGELVDIDGEIGFRITELVGGG